MNIIHASPINELGYHFVAPHLIPQGLDEYYLRNIQNAKHAQYRKLSNEELEKLVSNKNSSDDWSKVLVSPQFNPRLIRNCKFYGLVRIGNLEPLYKEFHDFKTPVGIYNSTIISCDLGDNVCIDNVHYLSHYILADDVIIVNVNEMATTSTAKFGNGVLKQGEENAVRSWIEVGNENGGRSILPFNGMLSGDAYLWSKYRDDKTLMKRFIDFTDKCMDDKRGYYGMVGERTVIKNCGIIKDVWIGSDAYIKGANKIKNVTINSDGSRKSQIGEGCEIVNGIVGYGCRIFYGVKAVRFVMSSHSQLKYGARLINSYLGNNSTISCCEVLNSIIFPSHEQHHNNSFLCAAMVFGQSNVAAGATIGSNHNSRAADGEIVAGRGFWPGLCVSLKHNSKFASYTLIAKGDYTNELFVPFPFSLVSIDSHTGQTSIMPGYWFMYNMYALERNAWKTKDRDRRTEKIQSIEFDYLAPDTINEMFDAITTLKGLQVTGTGIAEVDNLEHGKRKTLIVKIPEAIAIYEEMITYYFGCNLLPVLEANADGDLSKALSKISTKISRTQWLNIGGQLITASALKKLKHDIIEGEIKNWDEVHAFYIAEGLKYDALKLEHAFSAYLELKNITAAQLDATMLAKLFDTILATQQKITKNIYSSRQKDYSNPFRKMVYNNSEEMNEVLGKLDDNSFIQQQFKKLDEFKTRIAELKTKFSLPAQPVYKVTK